MHSNVTIKNVSWPHFSWPTLYMFYMTSRPIGQMSNASTELMSHHWDWGKYVQVHDQFLTEIKTKFTSSSAVTEKLHCRWVSFGPNFSTGQQNFYLSEGGYVLRGIC